MEGGTTWGWLPAHVQGWGTRVPVPIKGLSPPQLQLQLPAWACSHPPAESAPRKAVSAAGACQACLARLSPCGAKPGRAGAQPCPARAKRGQTCWALPAPACPAQPQQHKGSEPPAGTRATSAQSRAQPVPGQEARPCTLTPDRKLLCQHLLVPPTLVSRPSSSKPAQRSTQAEPAHPALLPPGSLGTQITRREGQGGASRLPTAQFPTAFPPPESPWGPGPGLALMLVWPALPREQRPRTTRCTGSDPAGGLATAPCPLPSPPSPTGCCESIPGAPQPRCHGPGSSPTAPPPGGKLPKPLHQALRLRQPPTLGLVIISCAG